MNSFAVVLVAALLAAAQAQELKTREDIKNKAETLSRSCIHVTNAPKDADKVLHSKDRVTDDTLLCYLECMYRGMGLLINGKFVVEEGMSLAKIRFDDPKERDLAIEALQKCSKTVVNDSSHKCGLGFATRNCFLDFAHEKDFWPELY